MNIKDLRYILAVKDTGSFNKAAQICNVTQPTLSGQIKKLEDENLSEEERQKLLKELEEKHAEKEKIEQQKRNFID